MIYFTNPIEYNKHKMNKKTVLYNEFRFAFDKNRRPETIQKSRTISVGRFCAWN